VTTVDGQPSNTQNSHDAEEVSNSDARTEIHSQSDTWRYSPERTAARKVTIVVVLVILVPSIIVAALLAKRQRDNVKAVNLAGFVTTEAYRELGSTEEAERTARADLVSAQSKLEAAESSVLSRPGSVEEAKKQADYAREQVSASAARVERAHVEWQDARRRELAVARGAAGMLGTWLVYSGVVAAAILAATLLLMYFRGEKRREFENRRILKYLEEAKPSVIEENPDDPMSLEMLWEANRDQLQHYHRLILNYATSTRQTTQVALLAGFSFLMVVGLFALIARSLASAVASSVVASAGAVVTGFIANAILRNADTSSREVLAFFSHPLEVERVLTAERVIRSMPQPAQDAAKLRIVEGLTRTRLEDARSNDRSGGSRPDGQSSK
jgi:hypothetical protein